MFNKVLLQKIIDYTLVCVCCLFPLTFNISVVSFNDESHPLLAINFSLSDLLIGLLLLLWSIKLIRYNEWDKVRFPPAAICLFVFFGLLSVANAVSISQWAKEFVQIVEYFILLYVLIINNMVFVDKKAIKNSLFIVTTVMLTAAFLQHSVFDNDIYFVRGFFINENVLGTFMCMVAPLIYAELLGAKDRAIKVWMGSLLALIFLTLLSASAMAAILIALLAISIIHSRRTALRYIAAVVLLGLVYGMVMPEKNMSVIRNFSSLYEQGKISDNYYTRLAMLDGQGKTSILKKDLGDDYLKVSLNYNFSDRRLHIKKGDLYKEMDNKVAVKNRYLEMQASLIMLSEFTPLGVGLGNFQNRIGMFYKGFPKVNTAEPGQHNQYLLIAATTGILGLTGFLSILLSSFQNNRRRYLVNRQEIFYLGLLGSIISLSFEGFFSLLLSAELLVPFIFIICFSLTDLNHAKHTTQ